MSGSKMRAFSADDAIRLLAHNLDFWVPAVTATIQDRLTDFPEVDKGKTPGPVTLEDGSVLAGAIAGNPRMGGPVWFGEDDAQDAVAETVEAADRTGQLRGILDAVRSHRIEDDFSSHWSYAREDFERKLHGKRRKVTVKFVELTDTIPVQGPESEVLGNLVTNDFLALMDARNQQIVVLLNSGMIKKAEIAEVLATPTTAPSRNGWHRSAEPPRCTSTRPESLEETSIECRSRRRRPASLYGVSFGRSCRTICARLGSVCL